MDIDDAVDNQQAQIDQLVVSGDSSPAAAQAQVGSDGTVYGSLKTRLDTEHNKHSSELAQKAPQTSLDATNTELYTFKNNVITNYVKKDEITIGSYPLSVANWTYLYANLPIASTDNKSGYLYCTDGDGTHGAGNYVSNGASWYFGGTGDQGYNKLKEDLKNFGGAYAPIDFVLSNGALSTTDGSETTGNTRVRTSLVYIKSIATIILKTDYQALLFRYNADGSFIEYINTWYSGSFSVPSDGYYRIMIRHYQSTVITTANVTINGYYDIGILIDENTANLHKDKVFSAVCPFLIRRNITDLSFVFLYV
jgi:hypothetical protein